MAASLRPLNWAPEGAWPIDGLARRKLARSTINLVVSRPYERSSSSLVVVAQLGCYVTTIAIAIT